MNIGRPRSAAFRVLRFLAFRLDSVSQTSSSRVALGSIATASLIRSASPKSIIYGSSATQLIENLARAFEPSLVDGDEVVLAEEHECNVGPWLNMATRAAARGIKVEVKWWKHSGDALNDPENITLSLETLIPLLSKRTVLVAFSACSNILGELTDIEGITKLVKEKTEGKAKVCLDCVAFAPHRRLDVQRWGVDFTFFSYYKGILPFP